MLHTKEKEAEHMQEKLMVSPDDVKNEEVFPVGHPFYELSRLPSAEQMRLATNTGTTFETLKLLAEYASSNIRVELLKRRKIDAEIIEIVFSKEPTNHEMWGWLAYTPNVPVHILKEIVSTGDAKLQKLVMYHPTIDEEPEQTIIAALVADSDDDLKHHLAGLAEFGYKVNAPLVDAFFNSNLPKVQAELIRNETLSSEQLSALFARSSPALYPCFLLNNNTPAEVLTNIWDSKELGKSTDEILETGWHHHPKTPPHILDIVAKEYSKTAIYEDSLTTEDPDFAFSTVNSRIAAHPKTSEETLLFILAQFSFPLKEFDRTLLRSYAAILAHPNLGQQNLITATQKVCDKYDNKEISESAFFTLIEGALSNPVCPEAWLLDEQNLEHDYQMLGIAQNPKTPLSVLEKILEKTRSPQAAVRVIKHPNVSEEMIEEAINSHDAYVLYNMFTYSNNSEDNLVLQMLQSDNIDAKTVAIERMPNENMLFSEHKHIPKDLFETMILTSPFYSREVKMFLAATYNFDFPNEHLLFEVFSEPTNELQRLTGETLPTEVALETLKILYTTTHPPQAPRIEDKS